MADRLKGITLEIGGDTQNLSKSLKNVNTDIRNTQSQLKDVQRLLKLDHSNVDLLRQKQQLLKAAVSETSEKLEALKKAQATMDANGVDKNSEQYMALQREIIDTEQQLKKLEDESRNFGSVLSQQLTAVGNQFEEVGAKISNVGDKISGAGQKMLPATAAITGLGVLAVNSASDMEESANKASVSFGDAADSVMAFSETALDSFGISKGTAMDMAAQFGDMATSMGLSDAAAADMATSLVGLSGDLASFKNIGIDQAMTALNGVFTGETESLKSLGVVMTQTNLLQFALENGMIKTTKSTEQLRKEQLALEKAQIAYNTAVNKYGEESIQAREADVKLSEAKAKLTETTKASLDSLSQAEQIHLRYAYVMNATAKAQGDFARTSDGTANSLRILNESTKEAEAAFGDLLLPIITPLIQKLTAAVKMLTNLDEGQKKVILTILAVVAAIGPVLIIIGTVVSGIGAIITAFGKAAGAISMVITTVPKLITAISAAGKAVSSLIPIILQFNAALLANPYLLIAVAIVAAVALITYAIVTNFDTIKAAFSNMLEYLQTGFTAFCEFLEAIDIALGQALLAVINGIIFVIKGLLNAGISLVEGFANAVLAILNVVINAINAIGSTIASVFGMSYGGVRQFSAVRLPKLANGGEVLSGMALVGEAGPELLTVSGGRAVVTPLKAPAGGGSLSGFMGEQQIHTDVAINFMGSLSQLAAVLQPFIVAETRRIGQAFTERGAYAKHSD